MRIQDQQWEALNNGQIIQWIDRSRIGFIAKLYRFDESMMTDQHWTILKAMAAVPEMLRELESLLQAFNRDDTLINRFNRPMGKGVRTYITYQQAQRIRDLLETVKEVAQGELP